MSEVGKVEYTVQVDTKSLEKGLNNAEAKVKKLGDTIAKIDGVLSSVGKASGSVLSGVGKTVESLVSGISKSVAAVGKIAAAGITATSTAVSAVAKSAVQSYADYEQLTGGVETLFKDSSSIVMQYAGDAYKTAGMSANQYMETVTGFSASLLQSLGGDTEKAAEYANRAVIDMADNANKMGTSMESIQYAYQGFAKQNYTMLDNLKLGYGGTKEEMERLIKDAAALTDIQSELGVTVDANSMSFGNIVNAISVMQKKMGIAGTTAEEASKTISGSIGMMKSAWQNLITGLGDSSNDFNVYNKLIAGFVESVETVLKNVIPVLTNVLKQIGPLIGHLASIIIEEIPNLIAEVLPSLLEAAGTIFGEIIKALPALLLSVVNAISTYFPTFVDGIVKLVPSVIDGLMNLTIAVVNALPVIMPPLIEGLINVAQQLVNAIPKMMPMIEYIIIKLVDGIVQVLPSLASAVMEGVIRMVEALAELLPDILPQLINCVIQIIETIINALPQILPQLVSMISTIIETIVGALPQILPMILNLITTLIQSLVQALPQIIPQVVNCVLQIIQGLIQMLPQLIPQFVQLIMTIVNILTQPDNLSLWFQAGVQLFTELINAIPDIIIGLIDALPTIIDNIVDFLLDPKNIQAIIEAAIKLFFGLVSAVPRILSSLISAFAELVGKLWQNIATFFQNFAGDFGNTIGGIFKNAINGILQFIEGFINFPIDRINDFVGFINSALGGLGVNIGYIPHVYLPRLASGGIVPATVGGRLIIAGEGGEDEWVVPESKMASLIEQLGDGTMMQAPVFNFNFNGVVGTKSEMRKLAMEFHNAYEEVERSRMAR